MIVFTLISLVLSMLFFYGGFKLLKEGNGGVSLIYMGILFLSIFIALFGIEYIATIIKILSTKVW